MLAGTSVNQLTACLTTNSAAVCVKQASALLQQHRNQAACLPGPMLCRSPAHERGERIANDEDRHNCASLHKQRAYTQLQAWRQRTHSGGTACCSEMLALHQTPLVRRKAASVNNKASWHSSICNKLP
jgi:hypothetical protein